VVLGSLCAALGYPHAVPAAPVVAFAEQEIRYRQPAAGEVFLVWGLDDGWEPVPAALRPPGTRIRNAVMVSPMRPEPAGFTVTVHAPPGALLHYGFLITKRRDGTRIRELWDAGERPDGSYQLRAGSDQRVDALPAVDPDGATPATPLSRVVLYLLLAVVLMAGLGALCLRVPANASSRVVAAALIALMLLGLAVRLGSAWAKQQAAPEIAQHLRGDEPGYDELAVGVLRGSFFEWPGRMPLYPLFLAACYTVFGHSYPAVRYVQAVVGTLVIPLTFWLARRFLGVRGSLAAAAIVALHYALVIRAQDLLSENLFTPLLLLAILAWVRALEVPTVRRCALGGALLGLATLCRPASALLPVVLPALLPRALAWRRRIALAGISLAAMAAVLAPWTLHNVRTFHRVMPLTVPGAVIFQSSPAYEQLIRETGRTLVQVFHHELSPRRNGGHNPMSVAGSDYFTARGVASIRDEPLAYVRYSLRKPAYFWFGNPHADWPNFAIFDPRAWTPYFSAHQIAGHFATRLLPLLGLASLWLLRRRLTPLLPLLAVLAYFTLFHTALYPELRYSEPLQPLLAIVIAAAAEALHRREPPAAQEVSA
jgi:hypothetical protein